MPETPPVAADELEVRGRLRKLLGEEPDIAPAAPDVPPAPSVPPKPAERPRDWLDDILGSQPAPAGASESAAQPAAPDRRRIQPWWTGRHVDFALVADENQDAADEPPTPGPNPVEELTEPADEEPTDATDTDTPSKRWRPHVRLPERLRGRNHSPRPAAGPVVAAPAPRMSLLEAYARIPQRIRWLGVHLAATAAGYELGWVQWSTRSSAWIAAHGWLNLSAGFYAGLVIGCELLRRRVRHNILPVRIAAAVPIASLTVGALLYGTGWQHLNLGLHP